MLDNVGNNALVATTDDSGPYTAFFTACGEADLR
jgi:hypothetical protein